MTFYPAKITVFTRLLMVFTRIIDINGDDQRWCLWRGQRWWSNRIVGRAPRVLTSSVCGDRSVSSKLVISRAHHSISSSVDAMGPVKVLFSCNVFYQFFFKKSRNFFSNILIFFFFHKTHKKNKKVVKHVRFYLIVFTRHLMALTRITYPMAMIKRWLCYDACNDDEVIALSGGHHEFLRALCVLTDQHRQN